MDALTYGAVASTPFADRGEAERWFDLLSARFGEAGETPEGETALDTLRDAADSEQLGWAAVALADYLQAYASDPVAVLAALADPSQQSEYVEASLAVAASTEAQPDSHAESQAESQAGEPVDESVWAEYLARWQQQWDGLEETWAEFRDRFLYWAEGALRSAAEQLISFAEASGDAVAALSPYGLVGAPGAEVPQEDPTPQAAEVDTDNAVIAAVLAENPELGAIGADRLEELYAEVLAELEAEPQTQD